jgi:hypothetical protein
MTKLCIAIGVGVLIAVSPLRDSGLAKFLIAISGG